MKLKLIQFMAVVVVAATAFVGLSSFVAADEDPRPRYTEGHVACSYTCYYLDSNGQVIAVQVAGTSVICLLGGTEFSCSEQTCSSSDCPN